MTPLKNLCFFGYMLLACSAGGGGSSLAAFHADAGPGCTINGAASLPNDDILFKLLTGPVPCPGNVLDLKERIRADGLTMRPSMVGNRGFHNAAFGSFSFFEMVSGSSRTAGVEVKGDEFFFGHFTAVDNRRRISLDQQPDEGKLMIELIVWDTTKGVYNFYEMIGDGAQGQWFYRGNSLNILADTKLLHRQLNPARPVFGSHLRCSGCHTNGGPIMKEFTAPHNDWWLVNHKLPLAPNQADSVVTGIQSNLVDADKLAEAVGSGQQKLLQSPTYSQALRALSLQERLRPLFCPVEMTIASDKTSGDDNPAEIDVPEDFFTSPLLGGRTLKVDRSLYLAGLKALRSQFPESGQLDADHGWLTPVKAPSDLALVKLSVAEGLIDDEFVADVLAVDATNPTISPKRCGLLTLLPGTAQSDWRAAFLANLESSGDASARELAENMEQPERTAAFHKAQAAAFLGACQQKLTTQDGVTALLRLLGQRRSDVFASEISKNPRGQIFEPGFRVIFPLFQPAPVAQKLQLTPDCTVQ